MSGMNDVAEWLIYACLFVGAMVMTIGLISHWLDRRK